MTSRFAPPRLPPPTPAPQQSSAVASARRIATPRTRERNGNNASGSGAMASTAAVQRDIAASKSSGAKQQSPLPQPRVATSMFPAIDYLLQTLESAAHSGVFPSGATEHRLLELVGAAKRELRGTAHHIAQLETQNDELESACRRYKISVSKIQTQSETLRRSSHGKDALCDAQLQKLVVLLREVHGYEDEPALSEDEQQQEQLVLSDISDDVGSSDDRSSRNSSSSSSSSNDDDSNQTEEEPVSDDGGHNESALSGDDHVTPLRSRGASVVPLDSSTKDAAAQVAPLFVHLRAPGTSGNNGKLPHALLSLTVAEPMRKSVHEPKPPRGSGGNNAGTNTVTKPSAPRGSRLKFQFPEVDLGSSDGYDCDVDDLEAKRDASTAHSPARLASLQRRRFSSSAAIATAVPLRRKSFTMKRSPAKRIAVTTTTEGDGEEETDDAVAPPSPSSAPSPGKPATPTTRWAARRKSTSAACYPTHRTSSSRSPAKWKTALSLDDASAAAYGATPSSSRRGSLATIGTSASSPLATLSPPSSASSTSSQMVVRVRERKSDGVPELVICKHSARVVVWPTRHYDNRMASTIALGPTQHGVMLRQLRFVKSVMHDVPWAKATLKHLLAAYTAKDVTKEQLYPQLTYLSHHVQRELGSRATKQRALAAKKHHLTLTLTLAAGTVNDLAMTKFGRRGKPHATQLRYDPSDPTRLHWLRKNGDRSDEFLCVDALVVREVVDTAVLKRAARKFAIDPSACVSLVTATRSLDLQCKTSLQRDWLLNALHDIVAFAKQYRAAGAVSRRQQALVAAGRR